MGKGELWLRWRTTVGKEFRPEGREERVKEGGGEGRRGEGRRVEGGGCCEERGREVEGEPMGVVVTGERWRRRGWLRWRRQ